MKRIIGVDYGKKRCGIAVTDPLQIVVSPYMTVDTRELYEVLFRYCNVEDVEKLVIGLPTHKDGTPTYLQKDIKKFCDKWIKNDLSIPIDFEDESFTSSDAKEVILQSGVSKKKRRDKALVDLVSAVLILQKHLGHI